MTVWFITGASRGFGRALTEAVLSDGDQVVATARDPQALRAALPAAGDALLAARLDVTDEKMATDVVRTAVERFGRIDVLVNNAGYGLFGSIEEVSDADARALFDTNVFGLLNVTRAVLPTLRAQRSGHIITMSSSAGFAVSAGRGLYGASKFAVEAISEALHGEVAPLGVRVTVVEPGSFRTGFLSAQSRRTARAVLPDYAGTVGTLLAAIEANDGQQPGDPARAVDAIRQVVTSPEPPLRLQLGADSVSLVEAKLATVAEELEQWRDLSLSTDFSD
ncbi:oxidoreductase [Actinoplanes sp. N902-109]|uniref:oxidoreductase n=1 Tax=Actinoplanes sp. (strain N902-109) TaxID=649831 RepID=UPI000329581D|nr:oxidoreductase [Actinoplanes sp. N902-109]AGL16345.1 short-chain dehydrogenase/reductase SDR [Actinoplanes sp. N902-109]